MRLYIYMRAKVIRNKDITAILILASAAVVGYAILGSFILAGEKDGSLFSETPEAVTTNL